MFISTSQACILLQQGHPVALPTETVYGLAAPLQSPEAIESVFRLKNRPRNNPLIIHVASFNMVAELAEVHPQVKELTDAFWPGPLTLILPIKPYSIPDEVTCGLPTAAFRVPNHIDTLEVIREVGPLVMPSANISGKPSATLAQHVLDDFGEHFPVVDGGKCAQGLESTILMEKEGKWIILREGAVSAESIAFVLGYPPDYVESGKDDKPLCPGQLYRHYSPEAKLIVEGALGDIATVVGFEDREYAGKRVFSLGHSTNPEEAAHRLYACLRELDREGIKEAWVDMDFPRSGLWKTLRNRLLKAAGS